MSISYVSFTPIPPTWTGCDIRSIFKQRTSGLNSEFSFSYPGFLTKESILPFYLPIAVAVVRRMIHTFPKGISAKIL